MAWKTALARLVDHRFTLDGIQLVDDVVALLAADQDAAHRTVLADEGLAAAGQFRRRTVGQVRSVAFAGVDHEHADVAGTVEHVLDGLDGGKQQRGVVAQRFTKAAGQHEIALHVDDEQRRAVDIEVQGEGFCIDRGHPTSLLTGTEVGLLNSIGFIKSSVP